MRWYDMSNLSVAAVVYLSLLAVASLTCFLVYGFDKRRAVRGGLRVPERTLHILAFLGGWPGAILARGHFHHKTKKQSFLIVSWLVIFVHLAIVGSAAFFLSPP